MLSLDDERWTELKGCYRIPFDPRPWLALLETGKDNRAVWNAFWEDLHHQGDVGEASYATVPYLVQIYRQLGVFDWNAYALVIIIELCREQGSNPPVPAWMKEDYFGAIQGLAETAIAQWSLVTDLEDVRAVLAILALAKKARVQAKFLLEYNDEELLEMESKL